MMQKSRVISCRVPASSQELCTHACGLTCTALGTDDNASATSASVSRGSARRTEAMAVMSCDRDVPCGRAFKLAAEGKGGCLPTWTQQMSQAGAKIAHHPCPTPVGWVTLEWAQKLSQRLRVICFQAACWVAHAEHNTCLLKRACAAALDCSRALMALMDD